jgi:gliding motility-associated-like protein
MKKITLFITFLICTAAFGQGEANNWYFGRFGGIKFFEDGSVAPLAGSRMDTNEGCSSMSDANGNLLFYTDGRNVWDRNHVLMPNADYNAGNGLLGDPSSTQSGIIVPKKDDPDIYYIFTVDEPHNDNASVYPNRFTGTYSDTQGTVPTADDGFNNGLNFSVVDLSVTGANGSIGDITRRNVHLLTYNPAIVNEAKYKCSEKITAVKNHNGTAYWVITHFIDKFYAFKIDADGVNTTPVITQINPAVPTSGYRRNSIGYLKASPDGDKLAIAHMQLGRQTGLASPNGAVYLYDFDDSTGIVTNGIPVSPPDVSPYGLEFSPQAKKLYVSYDINERGFGGLHQYNLLSSNIAASDILIANTASNSGALQLGPNGKIYRAINGRPFLDVINSPEEDGTLCGFVANGQNIAGQMSIFGLPPFITSLFSARIIENSNCLGQATQFRLSVNGTFDSVSWNFGDGTPASTDIEPSHTYLAAGTYNVIATILRQGEASEITKETIVVAPPVANNNNNLNIVECDEDNNGSETFILNQNTPVIRGSQSPSQFGVKYYTSQANADTDTQPVNDVAYTTALPVETIFARIYNKAVPGCYATTSFTVTVSNTPVLNATAFALCDAANDTNDADGRTEFDLATVTTQLVQNSTQFTTVYYATQANAQNQVNPLPQLFRNTEPNQQILFARITNITHTSCFAILPITLIVNPLPNVVNNAILIQCDFEVVPDGLTQFNLLQADAQLTQGNTGFTVAYYPSGNDAENDTNRIDGDYTNISNPEIIGVRVINTATGCFRIMQLTLQVNTNTTAAIVQEQCDDDGNEDGLSLFNLADAGLETPGTAVTYYANIQDAQLEQNSIPAAYTTTETFSQSVFARLENNNNCTGLQEIKLIVRPLPDIDITDEAIVCVNTREFITLDAGISGNSANYACEWSTGATTASIQVNQPGIYTVNVSDISNTSGCSRLRTITVTPSDVATIDHIEVVDLTDNNTVTVYATPTGGVTTSYLYSLDLPEGPFTASNRFENVTAGVHTVYVYDINGCGIVHQDISVLAIPKFFTPNADGVNDTWNIIGINALFYAHSNIYIFDRYGKLLASVDPRGLGWDGVYNGYRLPATDYWYLLELETGRTVKGHFSLIR